MKFKKQAWKPIVMCVILALLSGYIIVGVFSMIGEGGSLQDHLFQPKQTVLYAMDDPNLKNIMIFLPIFLLMVWLYLFRTSILITQYQDASDFGLHGDAKFENPLDVIDNKIFSKNNHFTKDPMDALSMERGIILGKVPQKRQLVIMPHDTEIDNRNVLVVGSSGSGKGQAFVFNNILNHTEETIVVTDPKGEIYKATHQIKRDQGYKVYQVDFINFANCDRYNPIDYVKNDEDARSVAQIIANNAVEDGKKDFWDKTGVDYLTAFIIYAKAEYGDQANMPLIYQMVTEAGRDEEYFDRILDEIDETHPAYNAFQLANMSSDKTRVGIFTTLGSQISIFGMNKASQLTKTSDFSFDDMQKEKTILYIKIKMPKNPYRQITAVFFEQLISKFYDIADQHHSRLPLPTIFMLDEFANIGRIDMYPEVLATCRGLGMSMMTIVQDFGQLEDKRRYGPEMTRSIINNHDTTLFLRTKDEKTAQYFSKIAGDTTVKHKQRSTSYGQKNGSVSLSDQHVKKPLLPPEKLTKVPKDICYLFLIGHNPIKLEKAWNLKIYGDFIKNYSNYRQKLGHTEPEFEGHWDWSDDEPVKPKRKEPAAVSYDEIDEDSEELTAEELQLLFGNAADEEETQDEQLENNDVTTSLEDIEREINELEENGENIEDEALNDALDELLSSTDENDEEFDETENENVQEKNLAEELPM